MCKFFHVVELINAPNFYFLCMRYAISWIVNMIRLSFPNSGRLGVNMVSEHSPGRGKKILEEKVLYARLPPQLFNFNCLFVCSVIQLRSSSNTFREIWTSEGESWILIMIQLRTPSNTLRWFREIWLLNRMWTIFCGDFGVLGSVLSNYQ